MKRLLLLLSFSGALVFGQVSNVHSVYLLPMSRGMDQYLASELTREHVFQVVTSPKMADAVFTDRIGEAFEEKLADLESQPPAAAASDKDKKEASKKDASGKEPSKNDDTSGSLDFTPVNKLSDPATISSFGRGKGTVFLVDPKSHRVLWSAYRPSKGSGSDELNRTASDIVSRLKRDLKSK
jgi:hypothetical protein